MAYYNANGQITIDENAARADVQKIKSAITKLQESQNSLNRLMTSASGMQGNTGMAIVEQSQRLSAQIKQLIERLNNSASLINKTVAKYREQDRMLARQIQSGGGI